MQSSPFWAFSTSDVVKPLTTCWATQWSLAVVLLHDDVGQFQRVARDDVRDLHRGRGVVRTGCQREPSRRRMNRGRPLSRNSREGSKRRTMARLDGVSGSVLLTVGDPAAQQMFLVILLNRGL